MRRRMRPDVSALEGRTMASGLTFADPALTLDVSGADPAPAPRPAPLPPAPDPIMPPYPSPIPPSGPAFVGGIVFSD